jgi:hypothetical protein
MFQDNLTPHKLSEGCLEWCSFISIWFCLELVFWFWFELVLTCGVCVIIHYTLLYIYYYYTIIIYYTYTILLYLIQYSSLLLSFFQYSSFPFSSLIYLPSSQYSSFHSSTIPHNHSILVGTYIYLFILSPPQQFDPAQIIGGMSRVV